MSFAEAVDNNSLISVIHIILRRRNCVYIIRLTQIH